jgi:hypothetical protein
MFAIIIALIANSLPKSENMAIRITVFGAICLTYLAGLVLANWPLTSLHRMWMSALLMAAGYMSIACLNMWQALRAGLIHRHSVVYLVLAVGLLAFWVGGAAIGSVLVCLRRRYWPVYPPGHCKKCGYCLFGLTSRRCPECGTEFASAGSHGSMLGATYAADSDSVTSTSEGHGYVAGESKP